VAEDPDTTYQLALDEFVIDTDAAERIAQELRDLDLTNLSPREVLDWLFAQQTSLERIWPLSATVSAPKTLAATTISV
jgi:hypothetical protein